MNPERWKRIDEIFHAALGREASSRAAFLAEACKDDDSLREEIEALLLNHEKQSSLFESPPADLAAEILAKQNTFKGAIAHYQIVKKIGRGGMGEVYLAEDTRLNRKVALKILPSEFTQDPDRVRRFEREARAVSGLNHPNILTIYDIGQFNSSSFIASEFIDGETLRQRMRDSKLSLKEILTIGIQTAEALDAAHQAGVIHRDIKPENIMLRNDGYVKVLDFGLAKLAEKQVPFDVSHVDTRTSTDTQPGIVVGTFRYMSPEQARGLKVDARSDIFSVGVVLYELITGKPPFGGETSSDILAAILEKHPPALRTFGEFPEELHWIITKTLAKDPEERYQSTKDLLADLKRIRKQLDVEEELKRSDPSRDVQFVQKARSKTLLIASLLIASAVAGFLFWWNSQETSVKIPFKKVKLTRLTSGGIWNGAISPDGKYVVYRDRENLYLKQLSADTEIKITTLPKGLGFYDSPRFSNDGESIYYLTWSLDDRMGRLYQIPVLGGVPNKLIEQIDTTPAFSSDGKKMVFVRKKNHESFLMIADTDGKNPRKIASQKEPKKYGPLDWSPDGKMIASLLITSSPIRTMQIIGIDLQGSQRILSDVKWFYEWEGSDLKWLSDGSGLLFTKYDDGIHQIYYLSYPDGKSVRVTHDPDDYRGISLTKNNKSLITTKHTYGSIIWTAPADKPDSVEQLSFGTEIDDGSTGLSWTPDGKILFHSNAPSGEFQIWVMNADGSDRKRITTGKHEKYWPVASPDGRYIVYMSIEEESMQLWRVDSNADNPILLSRKKNVRWPRIFPDSKWILCSTLEENKQRLLKISIDGSEERVLATHPFIAGASISPDGKQIAYFYHENDTSPRIMNIISSDGGVPIKSFPMEDDLMDGPKLHWTPDGSAIAYIRWFPKGNPNVFVKPLDGSAGRLLSNFKEDTLANFSWSFDGKRIAYSRVRWSDHIVVMQDIP